MTNSFSLCMYSTPLHSSRNIQLIHLPDALKALQIKLDDEIRKFLEAPYKPRVVTGGFV